MDKHGLRNTKLYRTWTNMHVRCSNDNDAWYERYGGRGIVVCAAWADFRAFAVWALAAGYATDKQIDRLDNDGPYSPENCRWVTPSENANNRSSNTILVAFGEEKTMTEWARDTRCAVVLAALRSRIWTGWDHEEAITEPSRKVNAKAIQQESR